MKKQKIKSKLDFLAKEKGVQLWLDESKTSEISEELAIFKNINIEQVQDIIISGGFINRESIDFTDTEYLLSQIVDIINVESNE